MNRKEEILAVKALGDRLGYGNMMSIATALWRKMLSDSGGPTSGAFIATLPDGIKKSYLNKDEIASHDKEIQDLFNSPTI